MQKKNEVQSKFQDVDCKDVKTVESPNANNTIVPGEPGDEYDDQAIYNSTSLFNSDGKLNVSEITAEEVKDFISCNQLKNIIMELTI